MQVKGIDHVNIIAQDLDQTIGFYETLLGFRAAESPGTAMGFRGCWLMDASGRPSIHVMAYHDTRHADLDRGSATGLIDHVALACDDFEGMKRRCEELGVEHYANDGKYGGLRQIFVTDPSNVKLELNFAGS